jgi:enamine deaminase RidA (YjgF/YER057c/UK114 family)
MPRRRSIHIKPVEHTQPIPAACRVGNMLFTSAIMGADPATGKMPESIEAQVANLWTNLRNVLDHAGGSLDDVVRIGVFVKNADTRPLFNKPWLEYFPDEDDRPARHTMIVENLPYDIQIEAIAVIDEISDPMLAL